MYQDQLGKPFPTDCKLWKNGHKGGELAHKSSGINSSKVCDSNIHKRTIRYTATLHFHIF